MKRIFENELIKKYSNILFFSLIALNILGIFGLSFLHFKVNNEIKNIKIEEEKQVEEKKSEEKNPEEKEKSKKKVEKNIVKEKKLLDNFILLNENEITPYNAFENKDTDLKEIELIAKSFYGFFNTNSMKEYIGNFKNFSTDIGGMFAPGWQTLTEEDLNKPFKMKDKVKILIRQHNVSKEYMIIIFAGEKPYQRFFVFKGNVDNNGKINLQRHLDIGNTEPIGEFEKENKGEN